MRFSIAGAEEDNPIGFEPDTAKELLQRMLEPSDEDKMLISKALEDGFNVEVVGYCDECHSNILQATGPLRPGLVALYCDCHHVVIMPINN